MNGKGDRPRNCFSLIYRENYDAINWHRSDEGGGPFITVSFTLLREEVTHMACKGKGKKGKKGCKGKSC